jgi:hypothetical protein
MAYLTTRLNSIMRNSCWDSVYFAVAVGILRLGILFVKHLRNRIFIDLSSRLLEDPDCLEKNGDLDLPVRPGNKKKPNYTVEKSKVSNVTISSHIHVGLLFISV